MNSTRQLVRGWQPQPDTRGTLDIIYSCVATIGLCSWSCVCLNIRKPGTTRISAFMHRLRWQIFTILFPEVTIGLAAEQWESANQGVRRFKHLTHEVEWTKRHAFFADMGGILLQTPEFPAFPIDTQQLIYLIEHGYLQVPCIRDQDIADKNKADGLARTLALVQVTWFTIQCVGRWAQGLGLCTLELSTLAFILCALNMQFFWFFKPLDVQSPIILCTNHTINSILIEAGEKASQPYSRTPLDFVKPPPDDKSLLAPFWAGVESIYSAGEDPGHRPIRYFANNKTMPPDGITFKETLYGILIEFLYFGAHFLGVVLEFPSPAERNLWLVASSLLAGLLALYLLGIYLGHQIQSYIGWYLFKKRTSTILELVNMLPRWTKILIHGPVIILYVLARVYILVEGFFGLRCMPAQLYRCVEWANFLPHM